MKTSESIINNLLIELDSLTYRSRNIKQCFESTINRKLKKRLIYEKNNIKERLNDINNLAHFLSKRSLEQISFSNLLVEKSKRALDEVKKENYLFFL
tara:strand:- start:269 stop:559 length:291 start_codon:yes stop_codon:yes gene_type:complete